MNDVIAERAKSVYRSYTSEQPTPEGWFPVEAWSDGKYVIVIGSLNDDDSLPEEQWHNCDAMGCSSIGGHVVARIELDTPIL